MTESVCRLYLITPPQLPPGFADTLESALSAGDVACLQLRFKGVTMTRKWLRATQAL